MPIGPPRLGCRAGCGALIGPEKRQSSAVGPVIGLPCPPEQYQVLRASERGRQRRLHPLRLQNGRRRPAPGLGAAPTYSKQTPVSFPHKHQKSTSVHPVSCRQNPLQMSLPFSCLLRLHLGSPVDKNRTFDLYPRSGDKSPTRAATSVHAPPCSRIKAETLQC